MDITPKHHGTKVYEMPGSLRNEKWDAIVIGSGIGGMSSAAALAKMGKKILVLEQHYVPGGYTHMFTREGFEWDVGVHAIGEMDGKGQIWRMWNWLAQDEVKWQSLGAHYDSFHFPDNYHIAFPNNKKAFLDQLKNDFPDEHEKIDMFFSLIKQAAKDIRPSFALKSMPLWLDNIFQFLWWKTHRPWWKLTCEEILQEIGMSEKLKTVLTAQWGYHGNLPSDSPFAMQALITKHFMYGAYFPEGGAKAIASSLLARVKEAGGQTICRAPVKEILIEKNRAIGVMLEDGKKIFAPIIISAASALVTIGKLLPPKIKSLPWAQSILKLRPSASYISLYLGLKGDIEKVGASKTNQWFFTKWERDQGAWNFENETEAAHVLYMSFPSLKNPHHLPGEKNLHTAEVVTFVPWELFSKWETSRYRHRPEEYEKLKDQIIKRLMKQLEKLMPELMTMVVYSELSTPLSAQHFARAPRGSIYGLDSSIKRFSCGQLRTRTPIKGLYLTGVDVATTGVTGGLVSGLLTAASIDARIYPRLI